MTLQRSIACMFALACLAAFGQSPQPLAFEAASLKPSTSTVRGSMRGGPGTSDPIQLTMTNVTLLAMIVRAYDLKAFQVVAPDWTSSRKYDVAAKVPLGSTKEQCNAMLQSLLAERFHLTLHRETKDLQGYELVVGKNGAKLALAKPVPDAAAESDAPPAIDANGFPKLTKPGITMMEGVRGKAVVSFLTAKAQPIASLADLIGKEFRLPVADRTGLSGLYDFQLEYAPERPGALPIADDTPLEGAANLMTAVQQQLGLKLNPAKVKVEMLIVDRADQIPTGN
jgi:uncharacterized protein (TIGR03435 family)